VYQPASFLAVTASALLPTACAVPEATMHLLPSTVVPKVAHVPEARLARPALRHQDTIRKVDLAEASLQS
jgi:hypothetical protein